MNNNNNTNENKKVSAVMDALGILRCSDNFEIEKIDYFEESFGDIRVLFKAFPNFKLRLMTDRGDVYYEVSSIEEPYKWHLLSDVFNIIGLGEITECEDTILNIQHIAQLIHKHKHVLFEAFSNDNREKTIQKLKEIEDKKIQQLTHPD